jgi:hypothetical protein
LQCLAVLFTATYLLARLGYPVRFAATDLVHGREAEWNLNWMAANRLLQMGLRPCDRVASIGQSMDAEWASIMGVKIVAEIPVISDRDEHALMRKAFANRKEIKAFWWANPQQKARVFQAFRKAGAVAVVVDNLPDGVDASSWNRVLPKNLPHLPSAGVQYDVYKNMAVFWLSASSSTEN